MSEYQLPAIKSMSDAREVLHDGKSCVFGFNLSDGRTENFVVSASGLGAIINHLQHVALQCAQAAARDTAAGEPFAAVNKGSILEASTAEVLARASPSDPLLRITDSRGLVHVFRLRQELALSVSQGLQSAVASTRSGH
jgi:hypothetical protein